MRTRLMSLVTLSVASLCIARMNASAFGQAPLGTAITYQGQLKQSGTAVDASADFQFRLFEAVQGGLQIGAMQAVNSVSIVDGLFTVQLDFGAGAFNGEARWLEIDVRSPAGSGSFTRLSPRQPIMAVPYALKVPDIDGHSLSAADGSPSNALYVDENGFVGIGTVTPLCALDVASGAVRINALTPILFENPNSPGSYFRIQTNGSYLAMGSGFLGSSMVVDEDGRVAIGGGTPSFVHSLAVWGTALLNGNTTVRAELSAQNANGSRSIVLATSGSYNDLVSYGAPLTINHVGGQNVFLCMGGGNIGMGRVPTANKLEVNGSASKSVSGSWLANSDARIKSDVRAVSHALDTLARVRLVSFRYADDYRAAHEGIEDRVYHNVIAQEFAQVFPDYVKGSGEKLQDGSEILQVDPWPISVYSAAAIQELRTLLDARTAELAQLRAEVNELKASVARLASSAATAR